MRPNELTLQDLGTLHLVFRGYRSHDGFGSWFRGQADARWRLLPKAGRSDHFLPDNRDLGRFNDWRNQAIAYTQLPSGDLEQLAVAQHHGLATRLLDWTKNPLVACFFACCELPGQDAAVFILDSPDSLMQSTSALPFVGTQRGVFGHLPNAISPRVLNQKALFTVHCDAAMEIEVTSSRLDSTRSNLTRLRIPHTLKPELLKMVSDYGIDRSVLFPDLDGLSWHVNSQTQGMSHRARAKLQTTTGQLQVP